MTATLLIWDAEYENYWEIMTLKIDLDPALLIAAVFGI